MPSSGTPSRPAKAGVNMDARAAELITRATAGGKRRHQARRAGSGARTSHPSGPTTTRLGSSLLPASAQDQPPPSVLLTARFLQQNGAVELIYLRGAAGLLSLVDEDESVQLSAGCWVMGRWPRVYTGHLAGHIDPHPTVGEIAVAPYSILPHFPPEKAPTIMVFGSARLLNKSHDLRLDIGVWLLVNLGPLPDVPMDGRLFTYASAKP